MATFAYIGTMYGFPRKLSKCARHLLRLQSFNVAGLTKGEEM
jgi:hypothetical protein